MKHTEQSKHGFLRRIVRLCLFIMLVLTFDEVVLSAVNQTPISDGALGILMGGWCTELLLTLLKRKFEVADKAEAKKEAENVPQEDNGNPMHTIGFTAETREDDSELWNSGK